jgi:hypothetical protein
MSETDAAPAHLFSYSTCTLTDGDIRLLEPTDEADGLHWSIRAAPVDDPAPEYDAISYVWGSNLQTFPIVCNEPLLVHGNLCSALPFLARRYKDAKSRPIWIDAVWSAVMHIMDNPWCYRVWVVEEAALAKEIVFFCGEHQIQFPVLRDVVCSTLVNLSILDTEGRPVKFYSCK